MKIVVRLIIALGFFLAFMQHVAKEASAQPPYRYELTLSNGYRTDDFDWSIASSSVNVLSELSWRRIEIYKMDLGGRLLIDGISGLPLYARANIGYGWILNGKNRDSDYNGNNRTQEYSQSSNTASGDNVFDAGFGIGMQLPLLDGKLLLSPLVGYAYRELNLHMSDGVSAMPATGSFPGLDSTYDTEWRGPWLGLDLDIPMENLVIRGSFEYHRADYTGVGNWNLRSDFAHPKSFEHKADGYGVVSRLGVGYAITPVWLVTADLGYQYWTTDPGSDKTFLSDGTTSVTRFNAANQESYSFMAGLAYRFR